MSKQITEEMSEVANEQHIENQEKEFLNSAFDSYERRCGYDD